MNKYESTVKNINAPVDRVYARLSDLSSLQAIQDRIDDPNFEQMLRQQIPADKMPDQQKLDQIRLAVRQMQFTPDTVSGQAGPLGNVTLRIIEREEPKLVKMALEGAPVQANLWIQMLPCNATGGSRLKVTVGAELNFFIRKMVEGKLKEGVEGIAQMLSQLPY